MLGIGTVVSPPKDMFSSLEVLPSLGQVKNKPVSPETLKDAEYVVCSIVLNLAVWINVL